MSLELKVDLSPPERSQSKKRRSSGRANKKPARLNDYMTGRDVNEPRKRTKSETSSTTGENNVSQPEMTNATKKSTIAAATASATSTRVASPVLATVQTSVPVCKLKGSKKYGHRGKPGKLGKR